MQLISAVNQTEPWHSADTELHLLIKTSWSPRLNTTVAVQTRGLKSDCASPKSRKERQNHKEAVLFLRSAVCPHLPLCFRLKSSHSSCGGALLSLLRHILCKWVWAVGKNGVIWCRTRVLEVQRLLQKFFSSVCNISHRCTTEEANPSFWMCENSIWSSFTLQVPLTELLVFGKAFTAQSLIT